MSRPSAATSDLGLALLERLPGDVVLSPYGLARALDVVRARRDGRRRARRSTRCSASRRPRSPGSCSAQAAWLGAGLRARARSSRSTPARSTLDRSQRLVEREDARDDPAHRRGASTATRSLAITDAEYLDAKWVAPVRGHPAGAVRGRRRGADDERRGRASSTRDDAIRLPYREHDLRFVAMLGEWREVEWRRGHGHRRAAALHDDELELELTDR